MQPLRIALRGDNLRIGLGQIRGNGCSRRWPAARAVPEQADDKDQQQDVAGRGRGEEPGNERHADQRVRHIIDIGIDQRRQQPDQRPDDQPAAISFAHIRGKRRHPDQILRAEHLAGEHHNQQRQQGGRSQVDLPAPLQPAGIGEASHE